MVILREPLYSQASVIDGAGFLAETIPKGCCKADGCSWRNKPLRGSAIGVPQSEGFGKFR